MTTSPFVLFLGDCLHDLYGFLLLVEHIRWIFTIGGTYFDSCFLSVLCCKGYLLICTLMVQMYMFVICRSTNPWVSWPLLRHWLRFFLTFFGWVSISWAWDPCAQRNPRRDQSRLWSSSSWLGRSTILKKAEKIISVSTALSVRGVSTPASGIVDKVLSRHYLHWKGAHIMCYQIKMSTCTVAI